MNRKIKFTLIELLVVIAIIAILAGMLLPVLNKARVTAQTSDCMSRQKQIGAAFAMYANDNESFIPLWWEEGSRYWSNFLTEGYIEDKIVFCASTKRKHVNSFYSYGANISYDDLKPCLYGGAPYNKLVVRIDRIPMAENQNKFKIPILGEARNLGIEPSQIATWYRNRGGIRINLPHNNRSNLLHADGHVATVSGRVLATEYGNTVEMYHGDVLRFP